MPRHPQIRGGQPADGTGESGIESPRTRSQGEATPEANNPAWGETPLNPERKGIRGGVTKSLNNPDQERPGAGSSHSRSVQEREPSDRNRRPDLPQGTMGESTGQGRNCQEQGPPRAGALWSKSPNEQGPPAKVKPPALNQRVEAQEANRRTAQNHGGNKGE